MKHTFFLALVLVVFACQRPAVDSNSENNTGTAELSGQEMPETNKEKAARMQAGSITKQRQVSTDVMPEVLAIPSPKKLCQNQYGCNSQTVYPLGWSNDGKFAYCFEYAKSASDMVKMEFVIWDLEKGEMTDRASYKGDSSLSFEQIWQNKKLDFEEAFSQYKIQLYSDFEVKSFPMQWQNSKLSCSVDNEMVMNDYSGKNVVNQSRLSIGGQGLGQKEILTKTYDKYALILGTEVVGYLQSPLEDRIVVIYAQEARGFEGPPNTLKYAFAGVDLTSWE